MKKRDFLIILLLGVLLIFFHHLLGSISSVTAFFSSVFREVVFPVMLGFVIAYILSIPVSFSERHLPSFRGRRALSVTLSLLFIILVLVLVLGLLIPELIHSTQLLYESVLKFSQWVQSYIAGKGENEQFMKYLSYISGMVTEFLQRFSEYLKTSGTGLLSSAVGGVTQLISSFVSFFISLIIGLYFVVYRERVASDLSKLAELYVPEKPRRRIMHVLSLANDVFSRFITAQCLEAVILGSLCAVGMVILRLPYAPMIGSLIAVTALIPIWGALIGGAVSAFMIAVVSPVKALIFLIFFVILQQTEGNLIYPRVVGASVGLPPVYTFIAVTVFGSFFGIAGMLLAVPLSSLVYSLLREHYAERKTNKV